MSHDIATIDGTVSMAYIGQSPWWTTSAFAGREVTPEMSKDVQAMLIAANMNWQVEAQPLYLADGRVSPHRQAVVRDVDNAILESVGADTHLVQNSEAFSILQPLIDNYGAHVETAGALGNGARVWMLVKLPEAIEPVKGDRHDVYLFMRHCHDNTMLTEGIPTFVRVVCRNTSQMAVNAAGGENTNTGRLFRIRKTASVHDKLKAAETLLRRTADAAAYTGRTFARMASEQITPAQIRVYIEDVFPHPLENCKVKESKTVTARRLTVEQLVYTSPGADLAGADLTSGLATPYAAYNAITNYLDFVRASEAKSKAGSDRANISALFGGNAATKLLALAKAQQLVAA